MILESYTGGRDYWYWNLIMAGVTGGTGIVLPSVAPLPLWHGPVCLSHCSSPVSVLPLHYIINCHGTTAAVL